MRKVMIIAATLVAGLSANATVVTLTPDADGDIRSKDLADNGYNRNVLWVANEGSDPSTTRSGKGYIRFALPGNIDTVASATLDLSLAVARNSEKTYNFYVLNDGVAYETNWKEWNSENTGNADAGLTWNNAPANDKGSPTAFTSDAASLGSLIKGASATNITFNAASLATAVENDSNGFITIMLSVNNVTSSSDQFASKENTDYAVPSLQLDYTPVPEPATLGLFGLFAIGLLLFRRIRRD